MSNVRDFGAMGDGQHDDTAAIRHALEMHDGVLHFPRGDYKISETIVIHLKDLSRTTIHGTGGTAKILMHGPGPAFEFRATHMTASAAPKGSVPRNGSTSGCPRCATSRSKASIPKRTACGSSASCSPHSRVC